MKPGEIRLLTIGIGCAVMLVPAFLARDSFNGPFSSGDTEFELEMDTSTLEDLAELLVAAEKWQLTKDGRIDVYRMVAEEYGDGSWNYMYHSYRHDGMPSEADVRKGDYRRFPWMRKRGTPERTKREPLLWERSADDDGIRLVAFTNGTVEPVDEETWAEMKPE